MSAEPLVTADWLPGTEPVAGAGGGWRNRLLQNKKGIKGCLENALVALEYAPEWQGVLHFDESALQVEAKAMPPWGSRPVPFAWRDDDDVRAAAWMQRQDIMVSKEIAGQAVQTIAREFPFHPIREYLNALEWDKIPRINDWLTLYLSAESSDYARAVGSKWLIGAVARIFKPGCKNDTCLVLEGPQGLLKSTALRTLAEPWFTDEIADLGTKDAALQVRGVWIIELAELDAMGRPEASRTKGFMSRSTDRYRPPYGRHPIEVPRESVFAGTVNHDAYLKDETGGRRFWPVRCGTIRIDELRRDRDQLWAEAVVRMRDGETWWIDSAELGLMAAEEQQQRYDEDACGNRTSDAGSKTESTSPSIRSSAIALKSYPAIGTRATRIGSRAASEQSAGREKEVRKTKAAIVSGGTVPAESEMSHSNGGVWDTASN